MCHFPRRAPTCRASNTDSIHIIAIALAVILFFLVLMFVKKFLFGKEPKTYDDIEHFLKKIESDVEKAVKETDSELSSDKKKKEKN